MIDTLPAEMATLATLRSPVPSRDPARVAEGFEALFLHLLLEPIDAAGGAFFGEGSESRVFAGLFRQQLADQMAKARPLGIADQLEAHLRRWGSEGGEEIERVDAARRSNEVYGKENRRAFRSKRASGFT